MRFHVITALALFAIGVLGAWEWMRDRWRSRRDDLVDRSPRARQLAALERAVAPPPMSAALVERLRRLEADEPSHITRERAQAEAMAERLRRREVVAESDFFDIEAATLGDSRCDLG